MVIVEEQRENGTGNSYLSLRTENANEKSQLFSITSFIIMNLRIRK